VDLVRKGLRSFTEATIVFVVVSLKMFAPDSQLLAAGSNCAGIRKGGKPTIVIAE
jgi:hypothetical protein